MCLGFRVWALGFGFSGLRARMCGCASPVCGSLKVRVEGCLGAIRWTWGLGFRV